MPTMHDVAKHAGVSLSTVSYALNGTRPISEETRQRIFASMEALGYRPHALARGLASKRSRIIALLFPNPERGLGVTELEFVTGATDAAIERGYNLVLWSSALDDSDGLRKLMQQGLVDGVIVMEVHLGDSRITLLEESELPYTLIGRRAEGEDASYIDIDFDQTTDEVVRYLAGLGHRNIAFFNQSQSEYNQGYGPAVRAQAGFAAATEALGVTGFVELCPANVQAGYESFNSLLSQHPEITALVAMNERAIPGVLQAIADRNWRVPDDISLVSIVSSSRVADMSVPPLTTMTSPSTTVGRMSVAQLIRQLDSHEASIQQLLPCTLEVRGSSGPCPPRQLDSQALANDAAV